MVLAGTPPSKTLLQTEMIEADLVLAVDGGFNGFQKYKLQPDLLLGDMDSVTMNEEPLEYLDLPDQDRTDLQKALDYVFKTFSIQSITFLGGGGVRTDHLLHNLHICASIDPAIKIIFKNEISLDKDISIEIIQRITPQCEFDLRVREATILSVLPICDYQGLNSEGLKWEIKNKDRASGFISQSNQTVKDDPAFRIRSGCAYIAVYQ
ncbi:MAG: thiamine diphosphokinase [Candidatus Marinimicrobia bacterium]|nr:thiamine diphosphokinase [Candidatus Neomarinimicrobiota bacterium]